MIKEKPTATKQGATARSDTDHSASTLPHIDSSNASDRFLTSVASGSGGGVSYESGTGCRVAIPTLLRVGALDTLVENNEGGIEDETCVVPWDGVWMVHEACDGSRQQWIAFFSGACRLSSLLPIVSVTLAFMAAGMFYIWGLCKDQVLGKSFSESSTARKVEWCIWSLFDDFLTNLYMLFLLLLTFGNHERWLLRRVTRVLYLVALLPGPYIGVLWGIGLADRFVQHKLLHIPLNVVFIAMIGIACCCPPTSLLQTTSIRIKLFLTQAIPSVTYIAILLFLVPYYIQSKGRPQVQALIPPISSFLYFLAYSSTRVFCLSLRVGHPGKIAALGHLVLLVEAWGRRVLVCGISDLWYMGLSSLACCAMDAAAHLTVDLRDAFVYQYFVGTDFRIVFRDVRRRRWRAEMLVHHILIEYVAVISVNLILLIFRFAHLHCDLSSALKHCLCCMTFQLFFRWIFGAIMILGETALGLVAARVFKLERWHGIPVHEAWSSSKCIHLTYAGYAICVFSAYQSKWLFLILQKALGETCDL